MAAEVAYYALGMDRTGTGVVGGFTAAYTVVHHHPCLLDLFPFISVSYSNSIVGVNQVVVMDIGDNLTT